MLQVADPVSGEISPSNEKKSQIMAFLQNFWTWEQKKSQFRKLLDPSSEWKFWEFFGRAVENPKAESRKPEARSWKFYDRKAEQVWKLEEKAELFLTSNWLRLSFKKFFSLHLLHFWRSQKLEIASFLERKKKAGSWFRNLNWKLEVESLRKCESWKPDVLNQYEKVESESRTSLEDGSES